MSKTSQTTLRPYIPQTTIERRQASTTINSLKQCEKLVGKALGQHIENGERNPEKTVLYLAYGSNIASKTFLGSRGIKPVSLINVYVPELRLTFDLAGLPYEEPCFATTRYRHIPDNNGDNSLVEDPGLGEEKAPLFSLEGCNDERKRWHKPLIGVVYEITFDDYAWMIATETGGRGYNVAVVDCYPFPDSYNPADEVPEHPITQPFKAHCLVSLIADQDDEDSLSTQDSRIRPDPTYAQPSARYLSIIIAGAEENDLPLSYRTYLSQLHAYRITTTRQRIGRAIFLVLFGPLFKLILYLTRVFAEPDGNSPAWLAVVASVGHSCMWSCYDLVFARVFGDGERTEGLPLGEGV